MQIIRAWTSGPHPIPRHDLNVELAEFIQYHVDEHGKLTGATLTMASGQTVEAEAGAAEAIFLMAARNDSSSLEFLGRSETPTEQPPQQPLARGFQQHILPAAFFIVVLLLLWEFLRR